VSTNEEFIGPFVVLPNQADQGATLAVCTPKGVECALVRGSGRQEQALADLLAASWQLREAVHCALTREDSTDTRRILYRALQAAGGLPDGPYTTIVTSSEGQSQPDEDPMVPCFTVIYTVSSPQLRIPATSTGQARSIVVDLLDVYGFEAWKHISVQDLQGQEHRPVVLFDPEQPPGARV
jgi:hypothetical protein